MTQRLRDLDSPTAEEAKLVELVRAAEPTTRSDAHMRRVRAGVDATRSRRPAWDLRQAPAAVLLLLLVAGVAAASASAGRAWFESHRAATEAVEHEHVRKDEKSRPPLTRVAPPSAPLAEIGPTAPLATLERQSTSDPNAERERRLPTLAPARAARTTAPRRVVQTPAEPARSREDMRPPQIAPGVARSDDAAPDAHSPLRGVRIVSSALAAMRRSNEPRAASDLLERYLKDEPHGPFVEEALGLAIEAAADSNEPERAASRAHRYLETYPTGRFVSVAQRALRRFSAALDRAPSLSK